MKNNMKRITVLMLAACTVFAAWGCAKKAEETKAPETTQAAATQAAATAAPETTQAATEAATQAEVTPMPVQEPVTLLHPLVSDYYECRQNEDNTFLYEIEAQFLELNAEEAGKYPALATGLSEDLNEYIGANISEFIPRFLENTKDQKLDLGGEKPFVEKTAIFRMDDRMASVLVNMYEFLGGAHGSTILQTFNYSSEEMRWVELSEIVKDNEALKKILAEELRRQYPDTQFFDLEKDLANFVLDKPAAEGKTAYLWTMDYDSIQIWFQEEMLGPHSEGSQMIDLAFADYPTLFTYNYGAVPADFILNMVQDYSYTLGGRNAHVEYRMDQHGRYAEIAFLMNGTESTFEIDANNVQTMYATRNGHEYFYVFTEGDDDEQLFSIYRLDGDTVTEEVPAQIGYLTREYTDGEPYGEGGFARYQTYEYPADPATGMKVTLKPDGKWGKEKNVTVAVEEDGTVTMK